MTPIGSYDAKTRLPELLREVEKGQSFVITNRGRPIAVLGPLPAEANSLAETIQALQEAVQGRQAVDVATLLLTNREAQ